MILAALEIQGDMSCQPVLNGKKFTDHDRTFLLFLSSAVVVFTQVMDSVLDDFTMSIQSTARQACENDMKGYDSMMGTSLPLRGGIQEEAVCGGHAGNDQTGSSERFFRMRKPFQAVSGFGHFFKEAPQKPAERSA